MPVGIHVDPDDGQTGTPSLSRFSCRMRGRGVGAAPSFVSLDGVLEKPTEHGAHVAPVRRVSARRAVQSWRSPIYSGQCASAAKAEPEDLALPLLARIGQVSGQNAATLDRDCALTDNIAWGKEVHALFVVRELVLGERSHMRNLGGLLNAVHGILGSHGDSHRGHEHEPDTTRFRLDDLPGFGLTICPLSATCRCTSRC